MIIHQPEFECRGGTLRISARLESASLGRKLPEVLWVEYPAWLGIDPDSGHDPSEAFAAALLLVAMSAGEELEVRGRISRRLAYGLERYQEFFHLMLPEQFQRIPVKAQISSEPDASRSRGLTCQAFSGGVDSYDTLWHHLPSREELPIKVTHAMMVHGFDVPLDDTDSFARMRHAYEPLLAKLGVTLIPVISNIRQVTSRVDWEMSHGSALAFIGLAAGERIGSFVVSSTCPYDQLLPWGSDPRVDHWLSSDRTELLHFGAHSPRAEKLFAICEWPPVQEGLRVCWERPEGVTNCCRCGKCLRTMMMLRIKGVLEHYPTFPMPYDRELARRLSYDSDILVASGELLIKASEREGNHEVADDIRAAMRRQRWQNLRAKVRRPFS